MNPYKNSNRTESSSLRARRIPTQIWRRKLPAAGRSRDLAWQLLRTATSPTRSTARSGPWIREENARSTGTRRATSYDYEEEEGEMEEGETSSTWGCGEAAATVAGRRWREGEEAARSGAAVCEEARAARQRGRTGRPGQVRDRATRCNKNQLAREYVTACRLACRAPLDGPIWAGIRLRPASM